jgi:hypothetical protein
LYFCFVLVSFWLFLLAIAFRHRISFLPVQRRLLTVTDFPPRDDKAMEQSLHQAGQLASTRFFITDVKQEGEGGLGSGSNKV